MQQWDLDGIIISGRFMGAEETRASFWQLPWGESDMEIHTFQLYINQPVSA